MKRILFVGSSRADLRTFPVKARRLAGRQLNRVQNGQMPVDWKPMPSIGAGVVEIRLRVPDGAFRVIYVAKFGDLIVVLHCFQKKSTRTSHADIALAGARYRALVGGKR
jgi:phage-related protein